jgi:hypothetical protein
LQETELLSDTIGTGHRIRIEGTLLVREIPRKQVPDARINMQLTPASEGL